MSTDYQQAPSQILFAPTPSELDPWLINATGSLNINWGPSKGSKRQFNNSPPLFDDDQKRWSPPSTPPFSNKKPAAQYSSSWPAQDNWSLQDSDNDSADSESLDGSSSGDESASGLYKTELCRSFVESGTCRYGVKCQFAHGRNELRPVMRHPKYKTEICKTFHTQGTCPYGTRCRFIHTTPSNSTNVTPSTSPYSSPPLTLSLSRSPSPANYTPKWTASWPRQKMLLEPQEEEEEVEEENSADEDGEDEGQEVPESPSPLSQRRLAIFRTISSH